jgi:hypothetical protein
MDVVYIPDIEECIPLPEKAINLMADLSPMAEMNMRAETAKLLSDLSGIPIIPSIGSQQDAHMLAKAMIENPKLKPNFSSFKNDTIALLAGMVDLYNAPLVEELSELKLYVINRLINEIETSTSAKDRIAALSRLGEVDGIDAFKKRSEVTVKVKPIEEVEQELLKTLSALEFNSLKSKPEEAIS